MNTSRKSPSAHSQALAAAFILAYAAAAPALGRADHHEEKKAPDPQHLEHSHQHADKCGHKAEKHGDHTDYEHDGHHHKGHDKHVDDCAGPEHEGAKADAEHKEHKHQHAAKCGHKAEKHGDHTDYEHDGHHHREHAGHTDDCAGPHESHAQAAQPADRGVASK